MHPNDFLNFDPSAVQGYLAHEKRPPPLGPPGGPGHSLAVGSWGGALSYERGTPVTGGGGVQRSIEDTAFPAQRVLTFELGILAQAHRDTSLIRPPPSPKITSGP